GGGVDSASDRSYVLVEPTINEILPWMGFNPYPFIGLLGLMWAISYKDDEIESNGEPSAAAPVYTKRVADKYSSPHQPWVHPELQLEKERRRQNQPITNARYKNQHNNIDLNSQNPSAYNVVNKTP
ncbi:unnamed protein product, partial [Meganyctiphanes norvegica]